MKTKDDSLQQEYFMANLFPDESGAFPVDGGFIVVVDVKLRKQDLIFICSYCSLRGGEHRHV